MFGGEKKLVRKCICFSQLCGNCEKILKELNK